MKTKSFCLWQFLAVMCLFCLFGCEDPDVNGKTPVEEFIVTVDEITHESLTITVTPPDDSQVYYACLFPDTETSLGLEDEALLEALVSGDGFENYICEGEQSFKYAGLIAHSNYRLVYFSYNPDFSAVTSDLYRSERYTTQDGPDMFELKVGDVGGLSANFAITPQNYDGQYYFYVIPYGDYVTKHNDSDHELMHYDYQYWKFISESYGVAIEDVIELDLLKGAQQIESSNVVQLLEWDTEYMAYVYGLDKYAKVQTGITKEVFRTAAPVPSSMTFEIGELEMDFYYEEAEGKAPLQGWNVGVTIKPSSDVDKYFVTITNNDWYEWYFTSNNKGRSDEKYIQYQILFNSNKTAKELPTMFKQGEFTYRSFEERGQLLRADKEYVVFVFGVDENGATTGITKKVFKTGPVPTE